MLKFLGCFLVVVVWFWFGFLQEQKLTIFIPLEYFSYASFC